MLAEKYPTEIAEILAKYPPERKRSAVMPLLYLAIREYGYVTDASLAEVAGLCGIEPTQVAGVAGFYSLYHQHAPGNDNHPCHEYLQICTDLPCALRGADEFAKQALAELGVKWDETTADGLFTPEHVMCLAACHRAPMMQVQNRAGIFYQENLTLEAFQAYLAAVRAKAAQSAAKKA